MNSTAFTMVKQRRLENCGELIQWWWKWTRKLANTRKGYNWYKVSQTCWLRDSDRIRRSKQIKDLVDSVYGLQFCKSLSFWKHLRLFLLLTRSVPLTHCHYDLWLGKFLCFGYKTEKKKRREFRWRERRSGRLANSGRVVSDNQSALYRFGSPYRETHDEWNKNQ